MSEFFVSFSLYYTRYKILEITILNEKFISLNFSNIRNQYGKWSLALLHLQVAEFKSNLLHKTIIIPTFHQEQKVEILDIKKA